MGEDLKFIDFHQLQIENKKHIKDIDDRNMKFQILKASATNIVATLTSLKADLKKAGERSEAIEKDLILKETSKEK